MGVPGSGRIPPIIRVTPSPQCSDPVLDKAADFRDPIDLILWCYGLCVSNHTQCNMYTYTYIYILLYMYRYMYSYICMTYMCIDIMIMYISCLKCRNSSAVWPFLPNPIKTEITTNKPLKTSKAQICLQVSDVMMLNVVSQQVVSLPSNLDLIASKEKRISRKSDSIFRGLLELGAFKKGCNSYTRILRPSKWKLLGKLEWWKRNVEAM